MSDAPAPHKHGEKTAVSEKKSESKKKTKVNKKAKASKEKKPNLLTKTLQGLRQSMTSNTSVSSEKKRFPIFAISATAAATAMFMVIVASFMQMSQIQAEMKKMEAEIRQLDAKERQLGMELEGKYSSKIEEVASDLGLSGKYHPTYYLGASSEAEENAQEEESQNSKNEAPANSLLNAISHSFKKFMEFID